MSAAERVRWAEVQGWAFAYGLLGDDALARRLFPAHVRWYFWPADPNPFPRFTLRRRPPATEENTETS